VNGKAQCFPLSDNQEMLFCWCIISLVQVHVPF